MALNFKLMDKVEWIRFSFDLRPAHQAGFEIIPVIDDGRAGCNDQSGRDYSQEPSPGLIHLFPPEGKEIIVKAKCVVHGFLDYGLIKLPGDGLSPCLWPESKNGTVEA
jgi:hypothetical protein